MNKEKVHCKNCRHNANSYHFDSDQCYIYNKYTDTYKSYFKNNLNAKGECELYEEKEDVA